MVDAGKWVGVFIHQKTVKRKPASGKGNPEAGLRLGAFLEGWVWRDMNARQTHFIGRCLVGLIGVFGMAPHRHVILITSHLQRCQFGKNPYPI